MCSSHSLAVAVTFARLRMRIEMRINDLQHHPKPLMGGGATRGLAPIKFNRCSQQTSKC